MSRLDAVRMRVADFREYGGESNLDFVPEVEEAPQECFCSACGAEVLAAPGSFTRCCWGEALREEE